MAEARPRNPALVLLVVALAFVSLVVLAAASPPLPRDRITVAAVVLGGFLVLIALALPAFLLSGWQAEDG